MPFGFSFGGKKGKEAKEETQEKKQTQENENKKKAKEKEKEKEVEKEKGVGNAGRSGSNVEGSKWKEYRTEDGEKYYVNVQSGESVWEIPQDGDDVDAVDEEEWWNEEGEAAKEIQKLWRGKQARRRGLIRKRSAELDQRQRHGNNEGDYNDDNDDIVVVVDDDDDDNNDGEGDAGDDESSLEIDADDQWDGAALVLQRQWKRRQLDMKTKFAIMLQRNWRGKMGRDEATVAKVGNEVEEWMAQERGAEGLQSLWRGRQSRKRVKEMRETNDAARKIQALSRGRSSRKQLVQQEREREDKAKRHRKFLERKKAQQEEMLRKRQARRQRQREAQQRKQREAQQRKQHEAQQKKQREAQQKKQRQAQQKKLREAQQKKQQTQRDRQNANSRGLKLSPKTQRKVRQRRQQHSIDNRRLAETIDAPRAPTSPQGRNVYHAPLPARSERERFNDVSKALLIKKVKRLREENRRLRSNVRVTQKRILELSGQHQTLCAEIHRRESELVEVEEAREATKRRRALLASLRSRIRVESSEDFMRGVVGRYENERIAAEVEGRRAVAALATATEMMAQKQADRARIRGLMNELDAVAPVLDTIVGPTLWR
eukprot:g3279.t1